MTTMRLMIPMTLAILATHAPAALAQTTFPAPLPGQAVDSTDIPAVPPANGSNSPPDACKGFIPLREDAEKKGKMIKAASERHASPAEACKLIGSYSDAEAKLMKFVEASAPGCGIPASVTDQLKAGHRNTERLQEKVCTIAKRDQKGAMPGQINDFGDPAFWGRAPRGPTGDFPDARGRF